MGSPFTVIYNQKGKSSPVGPAEMISRRKTNFLKTYGSRYEDRGLQMLTLPHLGPILGTMGGKCRSGLFIAGTNPEKSFHQ